MLIYFFKKMLHVVFQNVKFDSGLNITSAPSSHIATRVHPCSGAHATCLLHTMLPQIGSISPVLLYLHQSQKMENIDDQTIQTRELFGRRNLAHNVQPNRPSSRAASPAQVEWSIELPVCGGLAGDLF